MAENTGRYRVQSWGHDIWVVQEEVLRGLFRNHPRWETMDHFTTCSEYTPYTFYTKAEAVGFAQHCMKRDAKKAAFVSQTEEVGELKL